MILEGVRSDNQAEVRGGGRPRIRGEKVRKRQVLGGRERAGKERRRPLQLYRRKKEEGSKWCVGPCIQRWKWGPQSPWEEESRLSQWAPQTSRHRLLFRFRSSPSPSPSPSPFTTGSLLNSTHLSLTFIIFFNKFNIIKFEKH